MQRSPEQPEGYVLRGGQAGAARLRLIDRVKWPTTERLLDRAGLRAGMHVVDLGCGGDATLTMAALDGLEQRHRQHRRGPRHALSGPHSGLHPHTCLGYFG